MNIVFKLVGFVAPSILCPSQSLEVLSLQRSSATKGYCHSRLFSFVLFFPRSNSPCAKCNDSSTVLGNHIPVPATLLTSQKKRRKIESFLEWFSRWTNFESFGYTSAHQENFLWVFSRREEADAGLEKQEPKT